MVQGPLKAEVRLQLLLKDVEVVSQAAPPDKGFIAIVNSTHYAVS